MITSLNNEKVKNVVKLLTNAKARRMQQAFVVEGERIIREIPKERILECYVSEDYNTLAEKPAFQESISKESISKESVSKELSGFQELAGLRYETVDSNVFRKMSDTQNPQGILCVVKMEQTNPDEFLEAHSSGALRVLALEGIQDPGNMGTMIRTAEGAGFDMILADRNTVDIYNPKVTRSTMGSMFRMPVIYTDDLGKTLLLLKERGVRVYAAHLRGENDFNCEKYPERLAILIGNEGNGLSDEITSLADTLVKIPMKGKLESLNAAVAAALLMYEAGK